MKTTTNLLMALATLGLGLTVSGTAQAAAPIITGAEVFGGGQITIGGKNFGAAAGTVIVGGMPATVTSWNETAVNVLNPWAGRPYTVQIILTTSAGIRATGNLSVPVPVLSSIAYDRDLSEMVTAVSINGGSNQVHVSPGASFTLAFDYSSAANDDNLQFGLSQSTTPQACLQVFAPTVGHGTLNMTAPTTPGLYYVLFDNNQNGCFNQWDYGTPNVYQAVGAISVY